MICELQQYDLGDMPAVRTIMADTLQERNSFVLVLVDGDAAPVGAGIVG